METRYICDHDSLTDRYGRFILEPLGKGMGAVLGNALRRVLLSQLDGAAVTAVRIHGVLHEFAPIPGAFEDTSEVIRNLKHLKLKTSDNAPRLLRISVEGKGVVKARELKAEDGITVLNPDAHIVTLETGAKFNAEIKVETGIGFRHVGQDSEIGVINVAADFSPVQRAGYAVKEMKGNGDSLSLELTTDGSISPIEAIKKAADILRSRLSDGKFISGEFDGKKGTFVIDVKPLGHAIGNILRWALMTYSDPDSIEHVTFADYVIQEDGNLVLEVHTDGALSPKDAVSLAREKLSSTFGIFLAQPLRERGRCQIGMSDPLRASPCSGNISFGDVSSFWYAPDLLDIQLCSYQRFLQKDASPQARECYGLEKILTETFPVRAGALVLEYLGYSCGEPSHAPAECISLSLTYSLPVALRMRLAVENTERVMEEEVPMGEIPLMTDDGTFIINGLKRVVINELSGLGKNDLNDLSKKSVKAVGDFLYAEAAEAFARLKAIASERMAVEDYHKLSPSVLLCTIDLSGRRYIEPVVTALSKFFVRDPHSQVAQACNALDRLTHCRRLKQDIEEASVEEIPAEPRMLHYTTYGRICPLETTEGPNIGLIGTLAINAQIDEKGAIIAPYRRVEGNKVSDMLVYLSPQAESDLTVAACDFENQKSNPRVRGGKNQKCTMPARVSGDARYVDISKVDYVDAFKQQTLGVSASLIPLLEHNDPNRALMGCNMQRQAVPLLFAEPPLIQSGAEGKVALDSREAIVARNDGTVKRATAEKIEIVTDNGNTDVYHLLKHCPAGIARTWLNQKPIVSSGQKVTRGQVIADGSSTKNGLLSLGRNILVAYMPWDGYNFEDAILISEKLIKEDVFTSLHIQNYQSEIKDTRYGRETFARQVPGVEEPRLSHLDPEGIVRVGTWVREGDILVGKMTPKSTELSPEDKLLHALYGQDALCRYEDTSLMMPPGTEGRVTKIARMSRANGDPMPKNVHELVKVEVTMKRTIKVGDKLSGRHGNKGTISRILPEEDMPFMPDGTPVEMVLSPLGVPSRMNMGQILETHLGWAGKTLGVNIISPPFDGPNRSQIKDLLGKAGLPTSGMARMYDGRTGMPVDTDITVGYQYMMKLIHLVDDKIHARSTGPYSLFTQQPTGGKGQFGGQRFGEMETWALEAYGAAYTLRELLTVKSDDVTGRRKMYDSLLGLDIKHETRDMRHEKGTQDINLDSQVPGLKSHFVPETLRKLIFCLRGVAFDLRYETQVSSLQSHVPSLKSDISAMNISLASPEKIRDEWSHGVVHAEPTMWENHHPTPGGLFCEKIFGPIEDWQCQCGKLTGKRHEGEVCDECGVKVGPASMRNELMGHIDLAVPVCHSWLLAARSNPIAILLGIDADDVKKIAYYESYIVTDPGNTNLKYKQVLSKAEYDAKRKAYDQTFRAETGAGVMRAFLQQLDLENLAKSLDDPQKKRVVEAFQNSGVKPEWMILECLPVIPPGIRPTRHLEGGEVATLDLNQLYTRVISRSNKYRDLVGGTAGISPVYSQEAHQMARMVQEAVDSLFGNGRRSEGETGRLKSLSDLLKSKEGMFRSNLLGKRVDYSGQSVIVVGPELKLDECGLPESMALELFKPFVMQKLLASGAAHSISGARKMVDGKTAEARKAVREIAKDRLVMLNRAPTLHRVGIQTFKPVLTDLDAIRLHPLVCVGFNADFDGDQMAVHIPLSIEAQEEARQLMLSQKNILSSTHGGIIVQPSLDMIVGFYYMTKDSVGEPKAQFTDILEVKKAYELNRLGLHDPIQFYFNGEKIFTTAGRVLFNEIVPPRLGRFINQPVDKPYLFKLIEECHARLGEDETTRFLNDLDDLGFRYATRFGASIGMDTLKTIPDKNKILEEAQRVDDEIRKKLAVGEISYKDALEHRVDGWLKVTKVLVDSAMKNLEQDLGGMNPVFMMVKSGARGNPFLLSRLIGAGGALHTPTRELFDMPVSSNFMDGMSPLEYFIVTAGARYGLIAVAVITGRAGSLMRRMVSASQDVVITEEDCGTTEGIIMRPLKTGEELQRGLSHRISGRIAVNDVKHPETEAVIVPAGEVIDDNKAQEIENSGILEVKVRSSLTCEARYGICAKCYGVDLATGTVAKLGAPVGVIAGAAVGEPATQLTMRLFHLKFGKADYAATGLPRLEELLDARETAQIAVDGSPMPLRDILARKGEEAFRSLMLDELIRLYNQYGLDVNEKHFEILLSRMLSQVRVTDPGDTGFYKGELVSKSKLRLGKVETVSKPASAEPILIGLHKAALSTDSFLAAAAFGDTVNVLAQAAIRGSRDELRGMRENLIVGKLIPAGTGFHKADSDL